MDDQQDQEEERVRIIGARGGDRVPPDDPQRPAIGSPRRPSGAPARSRTPRPAAGTSGPDAEIEWAADDGEHPREPSAGRRSGQDDPGRPPRRESGEPALRPERPERPVRAATAPRDDDGDRAEPRSSADRPAVSKSADEPVSSSPDETGELRPSERVAPRPPNGLKHWSERDEADDGDDEDEWDSYAADEGIKVGALDPERKPTRVGFDDDEMAEPRARRRNGGSASDDASPDDDDRTGDTGTIGVAPRNRTRAPRDGRGQPNGARPTGPVVPAPAAAGRDLLTATTTGVVLAGAVIVALVVGKSAGGVAIVTVAMALAGLELFTTFRQRAHHPAIPVGLVAVVALPIVAYKKGEHGVLLVVALTAVVTLLWFLLGADRERSTVNSALTMLGVLYVGLPGAFAALILSAGSDGRGVLEAAIFATVGYDVVGYLVGSRFGRTPLAPHISPNKTVEGLISGMLGSIVVAVLFQIAGIAPWDGQLKKALALGFVVGIAAPLGDLVESMVKRDLGIKDTSTILPGHGGVLDRIDAMLFVVPAVYYLSLVLFG